MTVHYYFSGGITLFEKIKLPSCNIRVFSRTVTPRGFLIRLYKQRYAETTEGMLPNNNKIEICSLLYYRYFLLVFGCNNKTTKHVIVKCKI